MTKLYYAFVFVLILPSCYNVNKSEPVIPDLLLSKSQMIEILTEVQIAEASLRISKSKKKANELKPKFYDNILQEAGVTLIQFKENMDYYQNFPIVMEEIYESVLGNLSRLESNVLIEKEELDKAIAADSVARLQDSLDLLRLDSLARSI